MADKKEKQSEYRNKFRMETKARQKKRFLDSFSKDITNQSEKYESFLDNLYNASSMQDYSFVDDLNAFKTKHNSMGASVGVVDKKYKEFNLNTSDISLNDLKKFFAEDILKNRASKNNLENIITSKYVLTDKELDTLGIEGLSNSEITDLLNNKNNSIDEFIKKKLNINDLLEIEQPALYKEMLSFLTEEQINKISKKDEKLKEKIYDLINRIRVFPNSSNLGNSQLTAILDLFKVEGLFTTDFKKKFLKRYLPVVKIGDIKNVIGKENFGRIKQKMIDEVFGDDLSSAEKEIYLKAIKNETEINSDILINSLSDSIFNNVFETQEILYKSVENFINDFNEDINDGESRLEEEGPRDLQVFKKELAKLGVEGLDSFEKGSVLKITREKGDNYAEDYLKIDDFDDNEKSIYFSLIGTNKNKETKAIITTKSTENISKKYFEIIKLLQRNGKDNEKVSFEIFSEKAFRNEIEDKDKYELHHKSLDSISVADLKNNSQLKKSVQEELQEEYSQELDILRDQLKEIDDELLNLKNSSGEYSDLSKDDLKFKKENLEIKRAKIQRFIDEKIEDINNFAGDDINLETLVAHKNFSDLRKKIDNLDGEGKSLGLSKGIVIEYKDKQGNYISFEILGINKEFDEQTIALKNVRGKGIEEINYEAFFQAFKNNKAKRVENINSFEEILLKNNQDEKWKNLSVKNGELYANKVEYYDGKGKNVKETKQIDYLVSDKGDLIKIENIGNGDIEVRFGELKTDFKKADEDKNKGEETIHNISLEKDTTKLSYNELNKLIQDKKFSPDWTIGKKYETSEPSDKKNKMYGSFATRFWNRKSITELVSGGKMLIDGITESIKRGNDVRAAEFALGIASILPTEIQEDFETQVEMSQSEAMDKALTALGKISSGKATNRILGWLKNKDTAEYKKEAGLMYIAKYGVLYTKALASYKGSFLWYEALGGKVGDKLYEKERKSALSDNPPRPFDEKELIISLLGEQSGGKLKPKRRSKFNKEFKGKIAGGFEEENSDGYKDASDKRSIREINQGGMAEISGGTLPNGLAWAKRAVEKGGSLKQMNKIYFCSIYSGALYDAPSNILEKQLKTDWQSGNSMIFAGLGSTLPGQKLLNKTIKNLSKQIEKVEPEKYVGISKMAEKIYKDATNPSISHRDKVEYTERFWDKYGDVLSRSLFMVDDDDISYNKTDKIIPFSKDGEFKEYYDTVKSMTGESYVFGEGFMKDAVGASGAGDVNIFKVLEHHFGIDNSLTFTRKPVVEMIWPKILSGLRSMPQKIKDNPDNIGNYRKFLDNKLRQIVAGMISGAGKGRVDALDTIDPVGHDMAAYGIQLSKFGGIKLEDILDGTYGKEVFDNAVERVIGGEISSNEEILSGTGVFNENFGEKEYNEKTQETIEEIRDNVDDLS